ncbi:hypothetical protein [Actinacidiphila oryziradicis]|uniref:hypothetical protein n=1 Tax=Actinacidiphila oryziradicis TaxID=2571141 RepID=UPI0023F27F5C|nr:hypothetical protein [Actinacidiphila oryziradicis]MCW2873518.1 hypothetical protein [Actinacidiphila oryziradicis]
MPEANDSKPGKRKDTKGDKFEPIPIELEIEIWAIKQALKAPPMSRNQLETIADLLGTTLPDETDEEFRERQRENHEEYIAKSARIVRAWEERGQEYSAIVSAWKDVERLSQREN